MKEANRWELFWVFERTGHGRHPSDLFFPMREARGSGSSRIPAGSRAQVARRTTLLESRFGRPMLASVASLVPEPYEEGKKEKGPRTARRDKSRLLVRSSPLDSRRGSTSTSRGPAARCGSQAPRRGVREIWGSEGSREREVSRSAKSPCCSLDIELVSGRTACFRWFSGNEDTGIKLFLRGMFVLLLLGRRLVASANARAVDLGMLLAFAPLGGRIPGDHPVRDSELMRTLFAESARCQEAITIAKSLIQAEFERDPWALSVMLSTALCAGPEALIPGICSDFCPFLTL